MNCHSVIKKDSEFLLPIRAAYGEGTPVKWTRVHDLPDYVYFNHQAHVNATVGCETCHGRVDQMVKVFQAESLTMQWCIECHQDPAPHIRPLSELTTMGYEPKSPEEGERLVKERNIPPKLNCSTGHR
jgi:hypothetical protein